jgi:hypothetical protein
MPKNSKARSVRLKHRKAQAKLKERERAAREVVAPPPPPPPPARPSRARTPRTAAPAAG